MTRNPTTAETDGEVWYHGIGNGAGPRPIIIEDADGQVTGEELRARPAPLCVLCIGARTADGRTCPRCHGSGIDPDPEAPVLAALSAQAGAS